LAGNDVYLRSVPSDADSDDVRLHDPTVADSGGGTQILTLPFIGSSEALFAPTLTPGSVTLTLPAIPSGETLFAPALTAGAVTITLPAIASGETLFAPTLSVGAVTITLPFIASGEQVFPPTLGDEVAERDPGTKGKRRRNEYFEPERLSQADQVAAAVELLQRLKPAKARRAAAISHEEEDEDEEILWLIAA
jgi:hypothetical protein